MTKMQQAFDDKARRDPAWAGAKIRSQRARIANDGKKIAALQAALAAAKTRT
jgi:hypothetical protein